MSKISDLAAKFAETSKQEAESIEQGLKSDLKQLEQHTAELLEQSRQRIAADIDRYNRGMTTAILKPWMWTLATVFSLGLVAVLILWILVMSKQDDLNKLKAEIAQAENTLNYLEMKTGGIRAIRCKYPNGRETICVAINTQTDSVWGKNGEYRAILPRR